MPEIIYYDPAHLSIPVGITDTRFQIIRRRYEFIAILFWGGLAVGGPKAFLSIWIETKTEKSLSY